MSTPRILVVGGGYVGLYTALRLQRKLLAVGDESFQMRCFERIAEFRAQGRTIVLVSHGLEHIRTLCDDAIWIDHGEIRALLVSPHTVRERKLNRRTDTADDTRIGGNRASRDDGGDGVKADELRAMLTSSGISPENEVVTYCQGGIRAAFEYGKYAEVLKRCAEPPESAQICEAISSCWAWEPSWGLPSPP